MLVAIERTKFTYLYKYNQIRVDINQVIDKSTSLLEGMLRNDFNGLIQLFSVALPLFEQDHEVILLEIDKSKIIVQNGILISFDSIHCIYPLSKTGRQLLEGKINDDFIVEAPVFENAIEALRIIRSMEFRKIASEKLLAHFKLSELLNNEMISAIESSVKKNLLDKTQPQQFNTFLDHLVAYNKTPSYIPDGNIEYICKIGAIAIKYLGKPEEVFTNGPFYKSSLKYKSQINGLSYLPSYIEFNSIADKELKSSIEKMVDIISKDYKAIDIFKMSFFFLAFKSFLNKHDNNIELLKSEIDALITNDKSSASFVLAMLGYTFSFENIYEGLHRISNAPLLKSTQSKKLAEIEKRTIVEAEIGKQKELERASIEQENIKLNQVKMLEETKMEVVENILVKSNEIAVEEIINNPVENVSEPVVTYEHQENEEVLENDKNTEEEFIEINNDEAEINPIELKDTSVEKETITVQYFKSYLIKEQTKPKQKIWFELLDTFFPSKQDEITLENLLDKLDTLPEVKDKLLKAKKDKESLKAFFDAHK